VFAHQAWVAEHHLGNAGGHHLKEAVVEVVVEGHVQHQGVLRVQRRSLLGATGGGMPQRHPAAGLQGRYQLPPPRMVRPQAAHMQQLAPGLGHRQRRRIAKEAWRQRSHRHPQPLTHLGHQRRIKGEQHRVVGLGLEVGRQRLDGAAAVVKVTAGLQPGKGRHKRGAVVITELPYQLSKAGWIEKLAEQVNDGKINGIADIRDESDREGMRVVVELRRDSNPETVLAELQRRTALQSNYVAIMLALVHGKPIQLTLRQLLQEFLDYRELTLIRRTRHALKRAEDRLEVVEGLITAAPDAASARASLQVHLDINERQADAVLAMPLRRLTGLEQESLRKEAEDHLQERARLRHLLDERPALLDAMVAEFKALKKRFATPRRTRLVEGGDELVAQRTAAQRPNTELLRQRAFEGLSSDGRLVIQADGQVKVVGPQLLGRLHLDEPAPLGDNPSPARLILPISDKPALLAFTDAGRVALLRWEFAGQQPGTLEKFLPEGMSGERVVQLLTIPQDGTGTIVGLLSSDGRFKRLPIEDFQELSGRAASVLKLKDGVTLQRVVLCREGQELVVGSSTGRLLRLAVNEANLPVMGRNAQVPVLLRLLPGEAVVGAAGVSPDGCVLLASGSGQLKRLEVNSLRRCQRGDLGQIGVRFTQRDDQLIGLREDHSPVVVAVLNEGRSLRLDTAELQAEDDTGNGQPLGLGAYKAVAELVPLLS
jgi:DNA gyrase subunit A